MNVISFVSIASKIIIIFFIAYLFNLELDNYLSQPTYVSQRSIRFNPSHFPVITACPSPSFNFSALNMTGYVDSYYYAMGRVESDENNLMGWSGLQNNTDRVWDDISIIKTAKDCPISYAQFDGDVKYKEISLKFRVVGAFDPYGKCCEIIIPDIAENETLGKS